MRVLSFKQIWIIHDNTQKYSQIFTYSSYKTVVTWMMNVFLQGECWKDRHWCCNCPGFLWVPSIEGILQTLLGSPHLTDRSLLGTSLAVLGFPDYSLWKASLSSTCVQPAKTISTTLLQNKKIFHCRTRFVGTGFHENALSTNKESFYYYLYVAHTCVQPENAISPAVWPTNIFLSISLCVSPSSK